MARPQADACSEWNTPQANALTTTAVTGGIHLSRSTRMAPIRMDSTAGANTTNMNMSSAGAIFGISGEARFGTSNSTAMASSRLPSMLSAQPVGIASQARRGSRNDAGRNLRKLSSSSRPEGPTVGWVVVTL